jgi:PEP-CTERM motif
MLDRPVTPLGQKAVKAILSCGAAFSAAFVAIAPAHAIIYTGFRSISSGLGEAVLSITTDDTLGSLSAFNIVDYEISFANRGTLDSAILRRGNSTLLFDGSGLRASATQLTFDFDSDSRFGASNGTAFYAVDGDGGQSIAQCGFIQPCELLFFGNGNPLSTAAQSAGGMSVLATAPGGPPGGVPEPAAWALMIAGFGLVGAAMRRRDKVRFTVA